MIASMWKHLLLSVKDELLFDQTLKLINPVYENSGFVFFMMNDTLFSVQLDIFTEKITSISVIGSQKQCKNCLQIPKLNKQ